MQLGLYVHVPFCVAKCAYCSFYSLPVQTDLLDQYTAVTAAQLSRWGDRLGRPADTLYFGGGTPTLLGEERLCRLLKVAKEAFALKNAEITLEANPAENLAKLFSAVAAAGVNRVSLGVQSAVENELLQLSRRHNFAQVKTAVSDLKKAGITNFSVDVMLGIPGQTTESLKYTLQQLLALEPKHISAYMLSLEPGTPLYQKRSRLTLPGEEQTAALYLQTCETLEKAGFKRYEISNFAKPGFASRHNNKYWQGCDYLGLGPAAHSAVLGQRFYYENSLSQYLNGAEPVLDGSFGGYEEYLMLSLRLSTGVCLQSLALQYGHKLPEAFWKMVEKLQKAGYLKKENRHIFLTNHGALVSNAVITELLQTLE